MDNRYNVLCQRYVVEELDDGFMSDRNIVLCVIGVNEYSNLRTLSYCVNDADVFQQTFKRKVGSTSDFLLLSGSGSSDSPTKDNIQSVLSSISSLKFKDDDLAVFYFAGHGYSRDGKDYLAVYDTNLNDSSSGICTDDILAALNTSGAGTSILVIDACRSQIDRSSNLFGERTAEMARRKGSIVFFSCSPGEVSQELSILGNGHGVFTYSFVQALDTCSPATPLALDREVISRVEKTCRTHKLSQQRPYTTVAPIQKAVVNIIDGRVIHDSGGATKNMILIVGPTNAGKTTLGQSIATKLGFAHSEMSSFAWQRFQKDTDYTGSIQDFMEDEVWKSGNEDIIARDMIEANASLNNLVVCGPRRQEEIETIQAQGWNVMPFFLFSNAKVRYERSRNTAEPSRYDLSYKDFVQRDLREFGWGLAKAANMPRFEILTNESSIDALCEHMTDVLRQVGIHD
jgi:hypothetical protein